MESNESKRTECEVGAEGATVAVVKAVAAAEAVDPLELPPLYEAVDPDVLDSVVRSGGETDCSLTFTYYGYRVETNGSGVVTVTSDHA